MNDRPPARPATPTREETILLAPFVGLGLEAIVVPQTAAQFADAAAAIRAAGVVGFDTESKPTFVVGEISEGPHVVQFATLDKAYIFQLCHTIGHAILLDLLQSTDVRKVGFGLAQDRSQILRRLDVQLDGVLDLDSEFRKAGYRHTAGVRAAVAIVLNQKFHKSKRVTTSNWAGAQLSDKQLLYAANDAYAALRVMNAMNFPGTP